METASAGCSAAMRDMRLLLEDGRRRVLVEDVRPEIDGGRYPIKRVPGEEVSVECDLVTDGHDFVAGCLLHRRAGEDGFVEVPLVALGNDRFRAAFLPTQLGTYEYTVEGWLDTFATWRHGLNKKVEAGQDVTVELLVGARLTSEAARRARRNAEDGRVLDAAQALLADRNAEPRTRIAAALDPALLAAMGRWPDRTHATRHARVLSVTVEPPRGRFSAWYEMFPRSCGAPGVHGTLGDAAKRLPYVASMGFDVLYLPPVHPIGRAFRKGPNNTLTAGPGDPGSPWAIGATEGGHKAIHPELGTLQDFRSFVEEARAHGLELAMDIAFQASPDHPYVKEHPSFFLKRPDGTIQYAENPPKKYQDVYPFDFDGEDWRKLWDELLSVFLFWCDQGVRIFRVDNPHTKSLRFWEWCIRSIKHKHPDAIFLAEAFTRPKLMYNLAKAGFTQSYTYFTWRHTKHEFTSYLTELTRTEVADFYQPNFWPNTPDILPEHLQFGGRPTFLLRLLLASTMSSCWGMYGPPFELMEHVARPGAEEYIDNEKFQLRTWDIERPDSLREVIARANKIRRENPALQQTRLLSFHATDSDHVLAFSKRSASFDNVILVVANLDPQRKHAATLELDLTALGVSPGESFQVHDLLSDSRYHWQGSRAYVELDPALMPVHVFRVRRRVRSEHDFEYFL